jgi:hypothetical protein
MQHEKTELLTNSLGHYDGFKYVEDLKMSAMSHEI